MDQGQVISGEEELRETLTATGNTPPTNSTNNDAIPHELPWGRLMTRKNFLRSVDLIQSFSFGRGEECSIVVTSHSKCTPNFLVSLSKKHFQVEKCAEDNLIYISDFSKNGTFVNGTKLGRGHKKILKHGDEIAVSFARNTVYAFATQGNDGSDSFLPPQLTQRFANLRALGRGSCGEVRLVKDRDTFQQFAVKKIILSASNLSQLHKINHPDKVYNEINILRALSHPCVISMSDIVHIDKEVYLVLEYMAGGELTHRVLNQPMTEDVAKFYFLQMIFATDYLHSQGIIHRDLKPENILLLDDREETLLKITDFGLSKITIENDATTMCGTLRYVAPEVINNKLRQDGEYGKEVDVWSLGVILYFMISRDFPFRGEENPTIAKNIVRGNYEMSKGVWCEDGKDAVKDLINKMLQKLPTQRITIPQILGHEWITAEHDIIYRIKKFLQSIDIPMQELSLEPPPKRFKFSYSTSSSDESNNTLANVDGNYSNSPTICC